MPLCGVSGALRLENLIGKPRTGVERDARGLRRIQWRTRSAAMPGAPRLLARNLCRPAVFVKGHPHDHLRPALAVDGVGGHEPHALSEGMDMISLSSAAIVAFIMRSGSKRCLGGREDLPQLGCRAVSPSHTTCSDPIHFYACSLFCHLRAMLPALAGWALLRLTRLRRVGSCLLSYTHYEPFYVHVVNATCRDAASLQERSYALS